MAVSVVGLLLAGLEGDHTGPGVADVGAVSPDHLVLPLDTLRHAHAVPADPVHGCRPVEGLHHLPVELATAGLDLVPGVLPVSAPEVMSQLHPSVSPRLGVLAL